MDVVASVHVSKVEDARNPVAVSLIGLHKNIEVIEVTVVNALKKKEKIAVYGNQVGVWM